MRCRKPYNGPTDLMIYALVNSGALGVDEAMELLKEATRVPWYETFLMALIGVEE